MTSGVYERTEEHNRKTSEGVKKYYRLYPPKKEEVLCKKCGKRLHDKRGKHQLCRNCYLTSKLLKFQFSEEHKKNISEGIKRHYRLHPNPKKQIFCKKCKKRLYSKGTHQLCWDCYITSKLLDTK